MIIENKYGLPRYARKDDTTPVITKEYNDCCDLYLVDDIELDSMVKPWEAPEEYVFLEIEGSRHPEPSLEGVGIQ